MERCKHAPQEQAGFARLTDEALGAVMAPFPRRKQNETADGDGERTVARSGQGSSVNRGTVGQQPAEKPGPKYFYKSLLLICSSLLSRQMRPSTGERSPDNRTFSTYTLVRECVYPYVPATAASCVSLSPLFILRSMYSPVEAALNSRGTRTHWREGSVPRSVAPEEDACATTMGNVVEKRNGFSWLLRGAPPPPSPPPPPSAPAA